MHLKETFLIDLECKYLTGKIALNVIKNNFHVWNMES